jgi:hypothetical protein
MFERLKDRIGTALDCLVEFSTLGEYRLAAPAAAGSASAPPSSSSHGSGLGGHVLSGIAHPGATPARGAGGPACRTVAVGAIGSVPVATSAARRHTGRGRRPGAPTVPEQPCLHADAR